MSNNLEENKTSKSGLVAHIIVSLAFLALGICLLTLNVDVISRIVYSSSVLALGGFFIFFGAFAMIKYFFNHEYKHVYNYGFTVGVILVIIGSVFIFKADAISGFIDVIVCFIGVLLGTVMLQQSFALFHIQRGSWFISFVFGAGTVAASIYLLMEQYRFFTGDLIPSIYLVAVGGISLFSMLLMLIGLSDHKKESKRNKKNASDDATFAGIKGDESIFEDEPVFDIKEEVKVEPEAGSDALFDE